MTRRGAVLQSARDFVTRKARHHHVEQNQVGHALGDHLQRLMTIARLRDFIIFDAQGQLDQRIDFRIVFDNKNIRHSKNLN